MTHEEWLAQGEALFGPDTRKWRFVCPSCGHVAAVQDWFDAGAPESAVAFPCVGRWTGATATIFQKPGPCNYAGAGLFCINPVKIEGRSHGVFAFASDGERKAAT